MSRRVESVGRGSAVLSLGLCAGVAMASPESSDAGLVEGAVPAPQAVGLLQVWGTAWDQDEDPATDPASYGDPEDDLGFKVRRARVGLEGIGDDFRYSVLMGMSAPYDGVGNIGGEEIMIVDAVGAARVADRVWVSLGLQKVPVSRELIMSSADLALGERSVATEWTAPLRDVGVLVDGSRGGDSGAVRVRAGVFNGNADPMGDEDPGVMTVLRLDLSKGSGDLYRTYGTVEGLTVGLGLDGWMDQSFSTRTVGAGADFIMRAGGLSVLAEGRFNRIEPLQDSGVEPPEAWAETDRLGGFVQVGYTVGRWEPAVRVSTFDDSRSAEDNGDIAHGMAGVTWHGQGDTIRVGCGYVKRLELSGAEMRNDTARIWLQTRL